MSIFKCRQETGQKNRAEVLGKAAGVEYGKRKQEQVGMSNNRDSEDKKELGERGETCEPGVLMAET